MTRPAVAAWLVLPEVTFGHFAHLAYPIPGAGPGRAKGGGSDRSGLMATDPPPHLVETWQSRADDDTPG